MWNGKGAEPFLPEIKFFRTAVLYLRFVFATGIENVLLYDYAAAAARSGTAWLRGKPEAEKYFNSTCGDRMPLGYFLWFLKTASGSGMRVLPYKTWIFTDKEWINGADFF